MDRLVQQQATAQRPWLHPAQRVRSHLLRSTSGAPTRTATSMKPATNPRRFTLGPGQGSDLLEHPGGAGEGAQVEAVELAAGLGPGGVGLGLDDADEQEGEPAEYDVGADAFFEPVVDRPQADDLLHVVPATLDSRSCL